MTDESFLGGTNELGVGSDMVNIVGKAETIKTIVMAVRRAFFGACVQCSTLGTERRVQCEQVFNKS